MCNFGIIGQEMEHCKRMTFLDWGHSVGEIEIMVMDQDHITEATTKIESIGAELGKIFYLKNDIFSLFSSSVFEF